MKPGRNIDHNIANCCESLPVRLLSHSMSSSVGSFHRGPCNLASSSTAVRACAAIAAGDLIALLRRRQILHQQHEVAGVCVPFAVIAAGHTNVDRRRDLEVEADLSLVVAQRDPGGPAGRVG